MLELACTGISGYQCLYIFLSSDYRKLKIDWYIIGFRPALELTTAAAAAAAADPMHCYIATGFKIILALNCQLDHHQSVSAT